MVAAGSSKATLRIARLAAAIAAATAVAAQAPATVQRGVPYRSWSFGGAPAAGDPRDRQPLRASCAAPYKFAAGACVLSCPGGYRDQGRACVQDDIGDAR